MLDMSLAPSAIVGGTSIIEGSRLTVMSDQGQGRKRSSVLSAPKKGGRGGVGRPEAQNERRNTGASQKTALVRGNTPGARASRPRRVSEGKMLSLPGEV